MKTKDVLQYLIWTEYKVKGTGERQAFLLSVDLKRGIGNISQFSLRELGLPQGTRTKCIRTQGRTSSAGCHGKGRKIP